MEVPIELVTLVSRAPDTEASASAEMTPLSTLMVEVIEALVVCEFETVHAAGRAGALGVHELWGRSA